MSSRDGDAVNPGGHAVALRADVGQDAPDCRCAKNDHDGQDDNELRDFRCALIE